ncbi:MAG TPA: HEAT repeat domain-containing protein [Bryobacteraceae bacterium]|nr:HEAT repeat domain-containing protein [Bryobacteraceae bacterium]
MKNDIIEEKIAALDALRMSPSSALEPLKKALKDRNNVVCAKGARVAGELLLSGAIPDLLAAFARFLHDPVKTDPKCWAKVAIIRTLKDLGHEDPAVYLTGMEHVQFEPVWGGKADAAADLRGACALALVACSMPREAILIRLADLLADPEMRVRCDAARAIAQLPGGDSVLMLRVKALVGDPEPAVVGQCFLSLLGIEPRQSVPFVARFLTASNLDLRFEATAALGECPEVLAVEALIARWKVELSPEMRRAITLSLGVSRLPEAREFLAELGAEE